MGRKILLADDSITIQKVVNLTFSDEGIDVVTVGNGELAVRKLNDVKPDIVLADIYMPGKNGYEVCEYIKTNSQFAHIPVLLLVGAFEPFDQAEALRVKADGHLTKPFESRALVATVTRLLTQAPVVAPVASQPASVPPTPAAPNWQPLPPDATTTRLTPELATRFQSSIPTEAPKPESPKVEPLRASPVPPSLFQLPVASPVPTNNSSANAPASTSEEFGEMTLSYSREDLRKMPSSSSFSLDLGTTTQAQFPANAAGAPPLNMSLNTVTPANPFTADMTLDTGVKERLEELELPDAIPVPPTPSQPAEAKVSVYSPSLDMMSPLDLDEVELSTSQHSDALDGVVFTDDLVNRDRHPSEPTTSMPLTNATGGFGRDTTLAAYQSSLSDSQYEDITPLDLEPLDEVSYHSGSHAETVLEVSSEPLPIEELPAIDADEVMDAGEESKTLVTATPEPVVSEHKATIEMTSVPDIEALRAVPPVFELPPEEMRSSGDYSDLMPTELQALMKGEVPLPPIPLAQPAPPIIFELEKEPPIPDLPAPSEEFSFDLPDEIPVKEAPLPLATSTPIEISTPTPVPEPTTAVSTAASMAAAPMPVPPPMPVLTPAVADSAPAPTSEVAQPSEIPNQAPPLAAVTPVAPVLTITSIEQIPQHLIDEIVRRAVTKISEDVVREIAWEVVPELAELLIKKRLEQKSLG
ncbi:MAG: response regulator [Acidobacteriota bacterium]